MSRLQEKAGTQAVRERGKNDPRLKSVMGFDRSSLQPRQYIHVITVQRTNTATEQTMTTIATKIDQLWPECDYTEYERRICTATIYMLKYIGRNDPETLKRAIGLVKSRGILKPQTCNHVQTLAKEIRRSNQEMGSLPPWPILSDSLDEDVTSHVASFLDDKSISMASKTSRYFYEALAPRQRASALPVASPLQRLDCGTSQASSTFLREETMSW
jgi:hypothetical protein